MTAVLKLVRDGKYKVIKNKLVPWTCEAVQSLLVADRRCCDATEPAEVGSDSDRSTAAEHCADLVECSMTEWLCTPMKVFHSLPVTHKEPTASNT